MKTATYLRLSLLIPILVWGTCLLLLMLTSALPAASDFAFYETAGITEIAFLFIVFYIFGIIVWIFPYILLALILFFWSFIGHAQTALKVFALSPLAMTILTLAALNIITFGTAQNDTLLPSAGMIDQNFINLNLLSAVFALIWGYICVGIGFGIYKLLQRHGTIRDEETVQVAWASDQSV